MKIWKDSWLARESFSSHDETERMVWAGWLAGPHLNLGAPSSFGCPIFATVSSSLRWAIARKRDPYCLRARLSAVRKQPPRSEPPFCRRPERSPKDEATEYCRCFSPGSRMKPNAYPPDPSKSRQIRMSSPQGLKNDTPKIHNPLKMKYLQAKNISTQSGILVPPNSIK